MGNLTLQITRLGADNRLGIMRTKKFGSAKKWEEGERERSAGDVINETRRSKKNTR